MLYNTYKRAAIAMFMLCLVFVCMAAPFNAPAKADPISLIIAVVVAIGATVVVDAMSCGFNIFFYCDNGSGGSGGGSDGSTNSQTLIQQGNNVVPAPSNTGLQNGVTCYSPGNICGQRNEGTVKGGVCSASAPADSNCCPSPKNACGQVNYAAPNSQGTCKGVTVAPPSNASCPAPIIGDKGFYANPTSVRSGETTKLYWDVTNATTCGLTGGGLTGLLTLAIQNLTGQNTNAISAKTIFTLSCQNGAGGPTASQQTTVNLVPAYQEI